MRLRRAHGDEDQFPVARCLADVCGEPQPPGAHIPLDQFFEPGLIDWHDALEEPVDLGLIDVLAQDIVAAFCEARAGDQPNVARTDDCDLHRIVPELAGARTRGPHAGVQNCPHITVRVSWATLFQTEAHGMADRDRTRTCRSCG